MSSINCETSMCSHRGWWKHVINANEFWCHDLIWFKVLLHNLVSLQQAPWWRIFLIERMRHIEDWLWQICFALHVTITHPKSFWYQWITASFRPQVVTGVSCQDDLQACVCRAQSTQLMDRDAHSASHLSVTLQCPLMPPHSRCPLR